MSVLAKQRVVAIDVLRGLTVALMILVNDPGDWKHVYAQLDHAEWNGWTLTDLVFPSFLFIVGCSLVFSIESRLAKGDPKSAIAKKLAIRCLLLLAVGWGLSLFPYFHYTRLRLFGVLPRIAICGFIAGLTLLATRRVRTLLVISGVLLVGYWLLMRFAPVPGLGHPVQDFPLLDPDKNLAAWFDRGFTVLTQKWLHTGRLYEVTRDPEGFASTLPAIATALLGAVAGIWMRTMEASAVVKRLALAGIFSFAAGEVWNLWFPINKKLWTSSYVLLTAGLSMMALSLLYWLLDLRRVQERSAAARAAIWPWLVFGSNAIVAYSMSVLFVKLFSLWKVADAGKQISAWTWAYRHLFARGGSTQMTSLLFAIAFVALCFLPNLLLWRKKIFVRL